MKEEQLRKLLIGIKWFVVAVMVLLLYILYVKIQEKVRIQETKEDMVWQSYLEIMSRDVDSGSIPTKEEKMRHYCEECEETTEWEYEIYFEGRGSRPDWQRFMTEDQPQGYWTCQECGQVIKDEDFDEDDINNKEKENEN